VPEELGASGRAAGLPSVLCVIRAALSSGVAPNDHPIEHCLRLTLKSAAEVGAGAQRRRPTRGARPGKPSTLPKQAGSRPTDIPVEAKPMIAYRPATCYVLPGIGSHLVVCKTIQT
jgi:hypothetical protein